MERIKLKEVPDKRLIEAFMSGRFGGSGSYGGLDGQGSMVEIVRRKGRCHY